MSLPMPTRLNRWRARLRCTQTATKVQDSMHQIEKFICKYSLLKPISNITNKIKTIVGMSLYVIKRRLKKPTPSAVKGKKSKILIRDPGPKCTDKQTNKHPNVNYTLH